MTETLKTGEATTDRAIDAAISHQNKGEIPEAIDKWRSIANVTEGIHDSLAAEAWFKSGVLFQAQHSESEDDADLKEAVNAYDRVVRLAPGYATVYFNRGNARNKLGQYDAAIEDYDKAIGLNKEFAEAYINRGNTRSVLGQYDAAIADYGKAIVLQPDSAEAHFNRGNARNKLGQHKNSIADYSEAIALKPNYAEAYASRGAARNALGKHKAAIADFDQAIGLKPNYILYAIRGEVKKSSGDRDGAGKDLKKALKLASKAHDMEIARHVEHIYRDLHSSEDS